MPRTAAPSTNPRILSGYAPYSKRSSTDSKSKGSGSATTTGERRQLLLNDLYACDVQPEQVTCTRCSRTVRLQKGKEYHLAHWLDHRWRCDRAATADPQPRAKCRPLPERKRLLEADPDAHNIEADRVVCGKCNSEVKFRKGRPYALSSWNQHKMSCQAQVIAISIKSSPPSPPTPTPSERYATLNSDPLVAALESRRVKCALCLSWIDMALETDIGVHVWRRHRASCVAENFVDEKRRPRFFRLLRPTGSNSDAHCHNSPSAEHTPKAGLAPEHNNDQASPTVHHITVTHTSPSLSPSPLPPPPPPLSFSTTTSTSTSAAPTPVHSPRRTPSLFSASSPRPDYTPLSLSRFERERDDVHMCEKVHQHDRGKASARALGLHIVLCQDQPADPPPYLQRTHLSLPMPNRYWRFESIE